MSWFWKSPRHDRESSPAPVATDELGAHVVALRIAYQDFDEARPWQKLDSSVRWCSALVIAPPPEGGIRRPRLLVAGTAIHSATDVSARRRDGEWVGVRIVHADFDVNLAVLEVDDDEFFAGRRAARIAPFAQTKGSVHAIRWRDSRKLEHTEHTCLGVEVRANRADLFRLCCLVAPVPESWSQPIFAGDTHETPGAFVGLVTWSGKKRAGAIPPEVVTHYLSLVDSSDAYPGFCGMEVRWQFNRHAAQSRFLGASLGEGVIVTWVPRGSVLEGVLKPRDVLLSIDGVAIYGEGMTEHPQYGPLRYDGLLETRRVGDIARVEFIRDGRRGSAEFELRAWTSRNRRIPWLRVDAAPNFAVRGGLVFRELDGNYMKSFSDDDWREDAPAPLVARADVESLGERDGNGTAAVVVLASVLADSYTLGYSGIPAHPVQRVNGRVVDGVRALIEAFEHPLGGFHVVELAPGNDIRAEIVLDAARFEDAHRRILDAYSIPMTERVVPSARSGA